jgi:DNA-binding Lrp family transcriptional regulator
MVNLTSTEKTVAKLIQTDIPLALRPFQKLADLCDLREDEVLDIIKNFLQDKVIRKFGAILRHQKVGFTINALVIWSVPQIHVEEAGRKLAAYNFITHCYERMPAFQNKYNLFTMLHAREKDIDSQVEEIAVSLSIKDYLILESIQEYKKNSPEYF